MGDLLSGISPAGGAVGLLSALVLLVASWMLKRIDKGSTEVVSGYSALTTELRKSAGEDRIRALAAEAALAREVERRIRLEEYVRGLEQDLHLPHRRWTDESPDMTRGHAPEAPGGTP